MTHHTLESTRPMRSVAITEDYVEAAIVLAPQIFDYLEDVDKVAAVVEDVVRSWYRYREQGSDDVDPAGTALPLREYADRYADRVESTGLATPGEQFDYDRYLRTVWHQHLQRLLRTPRPRARCARFPDARPYPKRPDRE